MKVVVQFVVRPPKEDVVRHSDQCTNLTGSVKEVFEVGDPSLRGCIRLSKKSKATRLLISVSLSQNMGLQGSVNGNVHLGIVTDQSHKENLEGFLTCLRVRVS